jgi:tetratricopeptide (TPR) repeat protein
VDGASASRRRLASTMVNLGAQPDKIVQHWNFEEAEADLKARKPRLVICDFTIGKRSGLDLLQIQRQSSPEGKDCLFILVTGNSSQSAVARAAEEDIDSFILKPYTMQLLTQSIVDAVLNKLFPSEYRKTIEDGKNLLLKGRLDEAMRYFERAVGMHDEPALACFYVGQAEMMKKALVEARGSFLKGISYNKIHYKCLVGLYEILIAEGAHKEAYDVIRRVQKYFPANPKRLAQVIRLAVLNKKFDDIEALYEVFRDMEQRDEELIRHMVAGLIVAGQNRFKMKDNESALRLFKDAADSCSGQTQFLRRIIEILNEQDQSELMQDVLNHFPVKKQKETDFLVSRYLFLNQTATPEVSIQFGQSLVRAGHHAACLYRTLSHRLIEVGQWEEAETLIKDAIQRFPEEAARFERMLEMFEAA